MLVLTRPRSAALRTARDLRAQGVTAPILFSPVLRIVHRPVRDLPEGTLVFTSENGVAAIAGQVPLAGRRVLVVGPRTAAAASARGAICEVLGGCADALVRILIARGNGPYIHVHGAHVTGDLAARLSAAGIAAHSRVVYDQQSVPMTGAARTALLGPGRTVLPIYSPRSAQLIAEDLNEAPKNTVLVALSRKVLERWPWTPAALIARTTEGSAMLDVIAAALADRD